MLLSSGANTIVSILGSECNVTSSMTSAVDKRPQTRDEHGNSEQSTIAGIVTVVILGGIILFIIVYCKFYRKFKRMKTELAHVHYIADPHIQPGKKHGRPDYFSFLSFLVGADHNRTIF